MTSLQLRQGNPAKTRADIVVVGIIQGAKGPEVAPGGEDVTKAWGRKWRPLLAGLGVTGKPGEVHKIPTLVRTAWCSATVPARYSRGIDQPPKSANFAPSATCRSCSGD